MPGGRPSKYDPDKTPELARRACMLGNTNANLGTIFGVEETTIDRWLREKPAFKQAVKDGREVADEVVGRSLYERACGYTTTETKVFCNSKGETTTVDVLKHYPPDPTSMIFWLKNRRPDIWRDSKDITSDGKALPSSIEVKFVDVKPNVHD